MALCRLGGHLPLLLACIVLAYAEWPDEVTTLDPTSDVGAPAHSPARLLVHGREASARVGGASLQESRGRGGDLGATDEVKKEEQGSTAQGSTANSTGVDSKQQTAAEDAKQAEKEKKG